jgi:hypothetical protein
MVNSRNVHVLYKMFFSNKIGLILDKNSSLISMSGSNGRYLPI